MAAESKQIEYLGRRFIARRHPHTGLIHLTAEKGELPPALAGEFTSYDAVRATLSAYYSAKGAA